MLLFGRNIDNSFDIALSFSELCQDLEAMFLVCRSSVLMGSKLCSNGLEAMFLRGRSYVPNVVML